LMTVWKLGLIPKSETIFGLPRFTAGRDCRNAAYE
jgi:hypothetical protein